MNKSCLKGVTATFLLAISLILVPLCAPTVAQNTSTTTTQNSASAPAQTTNSSQRQTTTTTTQTTPTQTTRTETTGVDPLWIAAGVIGLLALLAIALLAMRGRSRDRVTNVRESTTVIKKDE
jgi:hypothetical protein